MTANVIWSSNLRLAVKNFKEMKTIALGNSTHEQMITTVEKQAILRQISLKPKDDNIKTIWM